MACATSFTGFTITSCADDFIVAGVRNCWFSPYSATTVFSANTLGAIENDSVAVPQWKPFEIDESQSNFKEDMIGNEDNKSFNIRQTFELVVLGHGDEATAALNQLLSGRWRIIMELESGEKKLFGKSKGLRAFQGGSVSGIKAGDDSLKRVSFTALGGPAYATNVTSNYVSTHTWT